MIIFNIYCIIYEKSAVWNKKLSILAEIGILGSCPNFILNNNT